MGAFSFETASWGKTPEEAFRAAVEQAQYEHGHGGYTGTIAEKGGEGLVKIDLPPRLTAAKLIQWAHEHEQANGGGYWRRELEYARGAAASAKPGAVLAARRRVKEAEKQVRASDRELAKFKRRVGQHLQLVERAARVYDDKWGPTGCVEIRGAERRRYERLPHKRGERLFLFFGMASS